MTRRRWRAPSQISGATPTYVAAQKGHEAVLRVLVEAGADVNKAMVRRGPGLS